MIKRRNTKIIFTILITAVVSAHMLSSSQTERTYLAACSSQQKQVIDEDGQSAKAAFTESKYANEEVVKLTLKQLREKFLDGKYWNHADNPGSENFRNNQDSYTSIPCQHKGTIGTERQTCNGFQPDGHQLSWQCMGYAEKLGYDATGYNPRLNLNGWFTDKNVAALKTLKPGDIVRYRNNGHSIYITGVDGENVTYTDCNTDGSCIIKWDRKITKSQLAQSFSYVRVAPFEVKANNISIAKAKVTLSNTSYIYNGKTKKPAVTVVLKNKTLKKGKDYTVTYSNTKNIGTGKVIITGIGEYEGKITKTIEIKPKVGTVFTVSGYQYRITSAPNRTVTFTGVQSKSFKTIAIPKTVKYGGVSFKITTVADKALQNNTVVTKVTIGSNVKVIGDYAFAGCLKLSEITLGSNVTTIEDSAFSKCAVLTTIVLPEKVTKIDKNAFYNCKKLKVITIQSTVLKQVESNALKGIYSKAKIEVPKNKYATYKKLLAGKGQSENVVIVKHS